MEQDKAPGGVQWLNPHRFPRSGWLGYVMAVAFIGLALWSRFLLEPVLQGHIPFATFFVAVALTAWFGGFGPCVLAVVLGSLASWYFVLEPRSSWLLLQPFQFLGLSAFIFTGLVIAAFSGQTRAALHARTLSQAESERRARDSEEAHRMLNSLLANVPEGITMTGGPPDFPVVAISEFARRAIGPSAQRVLGTPSGEHGLVVGVRKADGLTEPSPEEFPLYRATRLGQAVADEEWLLIREDGGTVHMLCTAVPVRAKDGAIVGGIACWRDVTEQKRMQEERLRLLESERIARQEAEHSSRVKDEFLATLSHELRSPLNAMVGWIHVLKAGAPTSETLSKALDSLERNSEAQARLIEDLLDMSRIVSGKFRLDVQTVDLRSLIRAAIESVVPAAQAKAIDIRQVLHPLVGPVKGDPSRLQQVIWNLLSNAVKFTPKGGAIEVLLKRVDSHCEISVSDTGRGIKPEFLPLVFDRFRQQDASTARLEGGLGLGLAIVKQLVEHHGGSVAVTSTGEGRGATFIVRIPIAITPMIRDEREVDPSAASPSPDLCLVGMRILVVDDDLDAGIVLQRILEERQATVRTATSAAEGLQLLQDNPPDVLISDIGMPGQDGYAFIAAVRRSPPPLGLIPAIALTGFARPTDRIAAFQAGFNIHIA